MCNYNIEFNADLVTKEYFFEICNGNIHYNEIAFDASGKMLPIKINMSNIAIQTFTPDNPPCYLLALNEKDGEGCVLLGKVNEIYYLQQEISYSLIAEKTLNEAEEIVNNFLEKEPGKRHIVSVDNISIEFIIQSYINEFLR